MEVAAHIDALRAQGELMAAAVDASDPGAPVPSCPEWAVRDLVRHMGGVHRWATGIYRAHTIHAYAEADAERLAELLPTLDERHAVVVVDTAGFGNQAATVAAAAADLVLVPVAPGEADVLEAQRTVAFVAGLARSTRRAIPVRVVINRVRRNTTLARHVAAEIERLGLSRLDATISEAVAYGEMGFSGALPASGAGADEIMALMTELRGQGWLP